MIGTPVLIGAPSAIGLRPYDGGGARHVDLTPGVLREHGVVARLNARDLGDVIPPARYQDMTKPAGRGRNEEDVAAYSRALAEQIAAATRTGDFVVLLGGDCSILLGALLGLEAAGKAPAGLVYIDAHSDFATLDESQSGSACSMNLALAVGRATTPLSRLGGDKPLVRAENVVHIGSRDAGEPYGNHALSPSGILNLPDPALREQGCRAIAGRALERVSNVTGGFWIHVDVDVLDPTLMPAVDTPQPGGLTFAQLAELLSPLVSHPRALGLQLAIYDPALDNGSGAKHLVDLLEAACTGRPMREEAARADGAPS
jgi:arginase